MVRKVRSSSIKSSSPRTELPATMLTILRAENPEMSSADHVAGKHATIGPEVRGACLPVLLD